MRGNQQAFFLLDSVKPEDEKATGGWSWGFKYQGFEKDVNRYLLQLCQFNSAAAREEPMEIGCGNSQGSNRNDNNQNDRLSCSPEIGLSSSQC